jgi:hypothetical protein
VRELVDRPLGGLEGAALAGIVGRPSNAWKRVAPIVRR